MNDIEAIERLKALDRMFEEVPSGAIEKAISALEKQMPKKPSEVDTDCNYFICPSCGESIYASDNLETHKFCLECGQAIDWSDNP